MKTLFFFSLLIMNSITPVWHTDFNEAQQEATAAHKLILLNFSGSDWCIPCIRTRKEIFETAEFETFSGSNLVLVNADFPRSKKNKLATEQVKLNEALADKYNPTGIFPLTILMDANGKIIHQWEGYPNVKPVDFIQEIKKYGDVSN